MSRSRKKGPYVDEKLYKVIKTMEEKGKKSVVKTYSRRTTIVPEFIGYTIAVHNGKKFIPVYIVQDMVGHKLGEFAPTRTYRGHKNVKKAQTARLG